MIRLAGERGVRGRVGERAFESYERSCAAAGLDPARAGRALGERSFDEARAFVRANDAEGWLALRQADSAAGRATRMMYDAGLARAACDAVLGDTLFNYAFLRAAQDAGGIPTSDAYLEAFRAIYARELRDVRLRLADAHRAVYGEGLDEDGLDEALAYRARLPWAGFVREWHLALGAQRYLEAEEPETAARLGWRFHPALDTALKTDFLVLLDGRPLVGIAVSMSSEVAIDELFRKREAKRYLDRGHGWANREVLSPQGSGQDAVTVVDPWNIDGLGDEILGLVAEVGPSSASS